MTDSRNRNRNGSGQRSGNAQHSHSQQGRKSGSRNPGVSSGRNSGQNHSRVVKYRQPINLNIGMIIFMVILIYVAYSIIRYATAKHVVGYEVRTGSISTNRIYTGVALRQEEVCNSDYDGYINYYSPELDRLAVGKLAYTIDQSGEMQSYLAQTSSEDTIFTDDDYREISEDVVSFQETFQPSQFGALYDFKTSLSGTIQKITNNQMLTDVSQTANSASLHYVNTDNTGYIVYNTDGYEDKTFDTLTISDFDQVNYTKTELDNNALLSKGDPAYKLETAEDWDIAILVDSKDTADSLVDEGAVECRFLKNQYTSWATVGETKDAGNGQYMVDLKFSNSMMTFATDRFITLEVITNDITGLKIPKSALIDDQFYVVPKDYVTTGASGNQGVLRQIMDSDGEKSSEFVTVTPYTKNGDDDDYYLERTSLRNGDILIRPDSTDTVTLSDSMLDTLTGVYNINEGYADFRQVDKLTENDDYAIVESNTPYGLREYDYIVLDATTMTPDEFLYE